MPATLRTIDMRLVYDGRREEFTMRVWVWAVLVLGLSVGTAGAQTQQQTAPKGGMEGMDMGQSASHPKDTGAGMDMGHCGSMGPCMGMDQGTVAIPAGVLRVTFGDKSADWTQATLAALPHKTVTVRNVHTKGDETYSGVPLIDLLIKLGVPDKPHGKDLGLYLVAVGSDGYKAVYSVAEVNPDVHDATVIVADVENGKALAADGPLKLIATRETRPARWVRNLVGVRVLTVQ
jgi:hypothetical protein